MAKVSLYLFGTAAALLCVCFKSAQASNADGTAFLAENGAKEGVVSLPSGLQYRVIASGAAEDAQSPGPNDSCSVHYEGSLIDGTVFDSSRQRGSPSSFSPSAVVAGWTEALQLMKEGDHWEVFLPSELAYGDRGAGGKIKAGDVLVFDLELLSVSPPSFGMLNILNQPVLGTPLLGWQVVLIMFAIYSILGSQLFGGGNGRKVAASHILVKDEELCKKLKVELDAAAEESAMELFKELAATHSACPSGKSSGGALGEFTKGQMVPEFDAVCWAAPVGIVQGPVQTGFGSHLILVTSRQEEEPPAITEEAAKEK